MKRANVQAMSTEALVHRFVEIALAQDDALLGFDNASSNRLYHQMRAVVEELQRRPGDQRHALLPLYNHENMQVRLQAARSTVAVAPFSARKVIEAIARSKQYPQAGYAGMALRRLDGEI